MIEITRYILAAAVAQTHLFSTRTEWTGQIAVFAFYTLSGYLITRVLNDRYGFTARGTAAFLLNRILRLWPAYLVIMGLVLVALCFLPLDHFFPLIRMPSDAVEMITNVTILGQTTFDFAQWLPWAKPLVTSWSLSIEVSCYLLLAFFFAKSSARLWMLVALGVVAMTIATVQCVNSTAAVNVYGPYCFQNRYGVVEAGFVPFAFGGLYYFHKQAIVSRVLRHRRFLIWTMIAPGLMMLIATAIAVTASHIGLSGWAAAAAAFNTLLSATVVPFIGIPLTWTVLASVEDVPPTRAQDFFGRASYHLFIAHMPLAAILVTGLGTRSQGLITFLATIALALCLSAVLVPVEWRINRIRRQISRSAAGTLPEHVVAASPQP